MSRFQPKYGPRHECATPRCETVECFDVIDTETGLVCIDGLTALEFACAYAASLNRSAVEYETATRRRGRFYEYDYHRTDFYRDGWLIVQPGADGSEQAHLDYQNQVAR